MASCLGRCVPTCNPYSPNDLRPLSPCCRGGRGSRDSLNGTMQGCRGGVHVWVCDVGVLHVERIHDAGMGMGHRNPARGSATVWQKRTRGYAGTGRIVGEERPRGRASGWGWSSEHGVASDLIGGSPCRQRAQWALGSAASEDSWGAGDDAVLEVVTLGSRHALVAFGCPVVLAGMSLTEFAAVKPDESFTAWRHWAYSVATVTGFQDVKSFTR